MPKKLQGYAAEIARNLAHGDNVPETLKIIEERLPGMAKRIYDSLSPTQQRKRSLVFDAGRIIQQTVEISTDAAAQRPPTLSETAAAIRKARPSPLPEMHHDTTLYIRGYGPNVSPRSVAGIWGDQQYEGYRARVDALLRAPSIMRAEVSVRAHDGDYEGDGRGYDDNASHAANIIKELCKKRRDKMTWHGQKSQDDVGYNARRVPVGDGTSAIAIVSNRVLHTVVEMGATFGHPGEHDERRGARQFTLLGSTVFAAERELIEAVMDGEVPPQGDLSLSGDNAAFVAEAIALRDSDMLAPAFTSFAIAQRIATA